MHATRMIIGEAGAVTDLWAAARPVMPGPREDRPGQPVYAIERAARRWLERPARGDDRGSRPAAAGLRGDAPRGARRRPARARPGLVPPAHVSQIRDGRSWLWVEDGTILFKAEASAWTPSAVQLQQVWVDPEARRQGHATRGITRSLPAAPRADADGVPLRPPRERAPRSACTRRSGCGGSAPTAACSSEPAASFD